MELKTIILYGRSGCGKGTQAELLGDFLKKDDPEHTTLYLQTGALLRSFTKENTHTSKLVKDTLGQGGLLPAFLPVWIWTQFFIDHFTGNEHIILDGLARRVPEFAVLDGALKYYKRHKPDVVLLEVSREWSTERLKGRGRHDDNGDDIKRRLDWYEENTAPAINLFRDNPDYNFHTINGEQSIEDVNKELLNKVFNK